MGVLFSGTEPPPSNEVTWRAQQEEGRELLRVCVRAWREATDGLPAGAAKWEMAWRRGVTCQLSRRLHISQAALTRWDEEWHPARRLLTWMRLVRASTVARARTQSHTWQSTQAAWREQRYYHGQPQAVQHTTRDARADERQRRRDSSRSTRHAHLAASSPSTPPVGGSGRAATDPAAVPDGCDETSSSGSEADDDCDDNGIYNDRTHGERSGLSVTVTVPRRRRTDKPLVLAPSARAALRRQLGGPGGDDARLAHAKRARGDG